MSAATLVAAGAAVSVLGLALAWQRRCLALVARASHELRGPLFAARLALHGLEASARVAAVDLELRRAALALEDLAAAPHGRQAESYGVPPQAFDLRAEFVNRWQHQQAP